MKKQLTLNALAMAYWRRRPSSGLLHHSDRGSQYACHDYREKLNQYGMVASMSRKGNCWDNELAVRFFRSLESERLSDYRFVTRQSASRYLIISPTTIPSVCIQRWVIKHRSNVRKNYAEKQLKTKCSLLLDHNTEFRKNKGAVKLHTLLDLRGSIPTMIFITHGKVHEINILDDIPIEPSAFYIMDRGYLDFARLHKVHRSAAFFVIRAKSNFHFKHLYSHPVNKSTGLQCDQTVSLVGYYAKKDYPERLQCVRFYDAQQDKRLIFLTNNFNLPALTIRDLYQCRWQIELFFKWIKQHLRIKAFYGTSENAVKTQIWIAIAAYVLVAIVKKQLNLDRSLYSILQILSITILEKMPILQAFTIMNMKEQNTDFENQLNLFN